MEVTEEQKAWAGGFFDGEGCISISKLGGAQAHVSQVEESVIRDLSEMFPGARVSSYPGCVDTNSRPKHHVYWSSLVSVESLLSSLLPYLVVKRERAVVALDAIRSDRAARVLAYAKMRELNAVGRDRAIQSATPQPGSDVPYTAWTSTDWAYYSGMFDAEGSVSANYGKNRPLVCIVQVDPTPLIRLANAFSVALLTNSQRTTNNSRKLSYVALYNDKAYIFLSMIMPYMKVKVKQAEIFMSSYDGSIPERALACTQFRSINAQGLRKSVDARIEEILSTGSVKDEEYWYWLPETTLSALPLGYESHIAAMYS